jgi:hypothetical protein
MTLNKTETQIMAEIERRGYATIEHGHGFTRHSDYGKRQIAARNTLIQKGLIKIALQGLERDSERGHSSIHYWSRIVKA